MATSAANTSPLAGTDSRKPSSVAPELEDRDVHSRASNGVISGREERTRGGCDGPPDVREKRDRPLWAVNRVSRSQWNGGFSADSGPSRGHRRRRTFRPIEASRSGSATSARRRLRPSAARDRKLLGGDPNVGNSLKSPQEIRTRSDAHGSINIQEGQPIIRRPKRALASDRRPTEPRGSVPRKEFYKRLRRGASYFNKLDDLLRQADPKPRRTLHPLCTRC
jgi:hypothetical protein